MKAIEDDVSHDSNLNDGDNHDLKYSTDGKEMRVRKCCGSEFCYIIFKTKFLKKWPYKTWMLRSLYGSIIVYISDYITDINILVLWSIDAINQNNGPPEKWFSIFNVRNCISNRCLAGNNMVLRMLEFFDLITFERKENR